MSWIFLLSGCSVNWAILFPYRWVELGFFCLFVFRISKTGRSIERRAPSHRGFTLHVASLFQTPQYIASFLSTRNLSCRSVPWRLKGGGIKPVVDGSGILHCISSAFIETCVYRVCVCVCVCVCVRARVFACVCMALCLRVSWRGRKRVKSEQTECLGIYVIHAENVQCCKADSHASLDSATPEGLYRPDLNVKCRRRN